MVIFKKQDIFHFNLSIVFFHASLEQWPDRSWERALQQDRGSSCSAESNGGGGGPGGLLYHPASEEASGQGVGVLFQHAPEDEGVRVNNRSSPLTRRPLRVLEDVPLREQGVGGEVMIR